MIRRLELDIPDDAFRRLTALAEVLGIGVDSIVELLLERVDEGIQRRGSWERDWLAQVFGDLELEDALMRSIEQANE
jgi:chloramphenicol 3-O-phosphotransferase